MSTRLTGYGNQITADDTYVLGCIDMQSRAGKAIITLTKIGSYDGTVLVKARALGSAQAFQTTNYEKPPLSAPAATAITPDALIRIDVGGQEVALTTSGRTVGSLQIDVSATDEL